jgi:RHS repeat-associated protein
MTMPANGLISWTPQVIQVGANAVVVQIDDGRGGTVQQSFTVNLQTNTPPTIVSNPPQIDTIGQQYVYNAMGSDPDGDPLQWSLLVAPAGMSIDPTLGTIRWTPGADEIGVFNTKIFQTGQATPVATYNPGPNDVGVESVVVRVVDGRGGYFDQSFFIALQDGNTPPLITTAPPTQAAVGQVYSYAVQASDADGDPLTFSLVSPPAGMSIDRASGLVLWTPTQAGNQNVAIVVDDGQGNQVTQNYTVVVAGAAVNQTPVITSTPSFAAAVGVLYSYPVMASDPDGDPVAFSLTNPPAGMFIDPKSGLVQWTPNSSQVPQVQVVVNATDPAGAVASQTFSVAVEVNHAPVITSTPPSSAVPGLPYEYDVHASDPDGDALTYQVTGPTGMTIDALGRLTWTPGSADTGSHPVIITVTDAFGASVSQSYPLTVQADTQAPVVSLTVNPNPVDVGGQASFIVSATDNVGVQSVSLTVNGTVVALDPSGRASMVMTQTGQFSVVASASDASGNVGQATATLQVINPAITPVITSTPGFTATVGQLYQYAVAAHDPDGDSLTYSLVNPPVGMIIGPQSGLLQWTPGSGQTGQFSIVLRATDPLGVYASENYTIVVAVDQPPVITSRPLTAAVPGLAYNYNVQASDPDGDPLTYSISGPAGMTIDSLGRVSWSPGTADLGSQSVVITVSDNHGNSVTQPYTVIVQATTQPPNVSLSVTPNPVYIGAQVTFLVAATDAVGVQSESLTVNGTPVSLDASGKAVMTMTQAGQYSVVASATDAAGNSAEATTSLVVLDPTVLGDPTVDLQSPADGAVITAPVDVIGTASDPNLLDYTLEVIPMGGGTPIQIGQGTSSVVNGVLGKFDPSLLANDSYTLQLTAENLGGNAITVDQSFSVQGNLKLGNFTLSFTDLSIPVSGIPITVSRTYDTLNANTQGDFGYGWRLEFANTDLRTSVPATSPDQQDLGIYNPFQANTRVYLTLPGGKREGFTFAPQINEATRLLLELAPFLSPSDYEYNPAFVPDPGVYDTLTVSGGNTLIQNDDGTFTDVSGLAYNPADPEFNAVYTLTAKDGLVYNIDPISGQLLSAADPNHNTLTFSASGITSSAGEQVTFQRDPQGRIIGVTDPAGKQVQYAYDDNGNLVSVTDRDGNTTKFIYDSTRIHYLDQVIDPLGRTGVRADYDSQGRLISVTGAAGNATTLAQDPSQSIETTVDALGNPSTYVYDAQGNIVIEIDARGGKTARTFDANNNMLTETDPLGNTISYTYDSQGNVLTETDSLGNVTSYTYGPFGRVLTTTDPLGHVTTNTYDSAGNLLSTTDAAGNTTQYAYDSAGNLTSTTDPAGNVTRYQYDSAGRMIVQIDALGHATDYTYDANGNQLTSTTTQTTPSGVRTLVTTNTYDAQGNLLTTTDAEGHTVTYQYDALGHRIAAIDALNRQTQYIYDNRGLLIQTKYPDGTSTSSTYDLDGNRISSTDQAGRTTTYTYDKLNRLVQTTFPDGSSTQTEYDAAGRVTAQVDELGHRTQFQYDADGNQILTQDALGDQTTSTYDADGHQVSQTDALGHTTHYVYDPLGRVTQTIFVDGTSTSSTYDALGHVVVSTDQAGVVTKYEYDALGRLTAVTQNYQPGIPADAATNVRTVYAYDELGDLVSQTDANKHTTSYQYNGIGERTGTTLPLGQTSSTTYDAAGNVASTTDFNGQTITYNYDKQNRLTAKTYHDGKGTSIQYTYTATGQIATIVDARGTTTYTYDQRDRLLSRTDPDGQVISYTYDGAGNRTSVTTLAGKTSFTFDVLNRTQTVTDPQGGVTTYSYDAASNLVSTTLPNGTSETRQYDNLNRLVFLQNTGPGGVISSYQYTLGPTGIRTDVLEDTGRKVHYDYDPLYRLIAESITDPVNGNRNIAYTYDNVGNRLTMNDSAQGLTTYQYDDNDRLMLEALAGVMTNYTYDNNGNTLSKVTSATDQAFYHWDFENRMIGADVTDASGTHHLAYKYNANGIRVASVTDGNETRYQIDANRPYAEVLVEYTPSGLITVSYAYGNALISQSRGGVLSYYDVDGLGSTRALTNSNGVVTDRYIYDAFGRTISRTGTTTNIYLFAGEQRDANIALDYLRARYLNVGSGRFVSRDPLSGIPRYPVSLAPYLYAGVDPVNKVDPLGRQYTLPEVLTTISLITTLNTNALAGAGAFLAVFGKRLGLVPDALGFGVYGSPGVPLAIGQTGVSVENPLLVGAEIVFYPARRQFEILTFLAPGVEIKGGGESGLGLPDVGVFQAWYWNVPDLSPQYFSLGGFGEGGLFGGIVQSGQETELIAGVSAEVEPSAFLFFGTPNVIATGTMSEADMIATVFGLETFYSGAISLRFASPVAGLASLIVNGGLSTLWITRTYGQA